MTDSPKIDGVEAVFRHIDDIEWTEVQRQRNADGNVSSIREKWPIIRPGFLSAYVFYEPGMVVRRHGHRSNHIVFVLGGSGWLHGEPCHPGTHVHVPLGAAFGPIVAGPDGQVLVRGPVDEEAVLHLTLDKAAIETQRVGWPFLRDRRIDAYEGLVRRFDD